MSATTTLQRSASTARKTSTGSPSSPMHRLHSSTSSRSASQHHHQRPDSESVPPESADAAFEQFSKDDIFSKFLSDDFDVTRFVSEALRSGSAVACSEKLKEGIRLMDRQLRNEVYLRHDELLELLTSLKETESSVALMKGGSQSLLACVQRIRSEIAEPYKEIKNKTCQLTSLNVTMELLRSVIRALRQIKKLKEVMESDVSKPDLAKAAQLYNEVDILRREADLSGVEVLEAEIPWLAETGNTIREEAMKVLEDGMEALNQAEVGSALQVYYNMGELKPTIDAMVNKYKSQVTKSIIIALDMKAISASAGGSLGPGGVQRAGTPQLGGSSRARENLWQRMGPCLEQLHSTMLAIWHLQRVLSKKRDPISHVVFLDEVIQTGDAFLTKRVWEALVKAFTSQMASSFTASSFIKETFVLGYPKLLSMINNLLERLVRDTDVKGIPHAIKDQEKEQLLAALKPYETAYLAQCLNRLSDLVNTMFPYGIRGSIPSQDQISKLISRIQEEIEAVKLDGFLLLAVLHEVDKVLQLLSEKFEYQIATGPDSCQVTGPATPSQIKNFALCLQLQEVVSRINAIVSDIPQATDILSASLEAARRVVFDSVETLFQAMEEQLAHIILKIHDQNFGSEHADTGIVDGCSKYMEELHKATIHYRVEFFSKLLPSTSYMTKSDSITVKRATGTATRVLVFFVQHAALVRPLSESGKLRMTKDITELELAAGEIVPIEELGGPFRALRAFKHLIFLQTSVLGNSPILRELPPIVVLHHLYSRAPIELESPMKSKGLTPMQYSLWLDSLPEEKKVQQVWKGIKTTLEDYSQKINARGDKEFSPIYTLMWKLGTSLVKEESSKAHSSM